ncbi:MAG: CapA family protein [Chitinophagaceae bacterium]
MANRLKTERISIAAVGDISFQGRHADHPSSEPFRQVAHILRSHDLVIGNLECPLVVGGTHLPNKCCLRGSPEWAGMLKESRFDVLSLANNHIMDYGPSGLNQTIDALDDAGILHVGAGGTIQEANAPLLMECAGDKIAILARSSVIVRSPSYASERQPGAAFLNEKELISNLRECKRAADIVILLMHWGVEEYVLPTPEQRTWSKKFAKAGADLVLGHHPHVLQGIERDGNSLVAYSLGNFLFDEFEWESMSGNGNHRKIYSGLSPENREGLILKIREEASDTEFSYEGIYTKISDDANIHVDINPPKNLMLECMSQDFFKTFYNQKWHLYSMKKEWDLRLRSTFSLHNILKNIRKLRPHHFRETIGMIHRSLKIAFGKSTNPYD